MLFFYSIKVIAVDIVISSTAVSAAIIIHHRDYALNCIIGLAMVMVVVAAVAILMVLVRLAMTMVIMIMGMVMMVVMIVMMMI